MTAMGFVKRASVDAAVALGVVALVVTVLGGAPAGIGVLAGGALGLGNLWWLARRAVAASETPVSRWSLGAVLRLAAVGGAVAVVLGTGAGHPLGVVVGLTVLPCVLIARGLAAAREA
jgi:hypothetical protein